MPGQAKVFPRHFSHTRPPRKSRALVQLPTVVSQRLDHRNPSARAAEAAAGESRGNVFVQCMMSGRRPRIRSRNSTKTLRFQKVLRAATKRLSLSRRLSAAAGPAAPRVRGPTAAQPPRQRTGSSPPEAVDSSCGKAGFSWRRFLMEPLWCARTAALQYARNSVNETREPFRANPDDT